MSRSGNLTIPYTSVRTTIILLLHVEIPQNSSMIQHTVLLSYIDWMILFFDMWSLLNVYYQFMSFHSVELLEMSQCSETSVCTAITRSKIMVSLVYREFLQAGSFYSYLGGIWSVGILVIILYYYQHSAVFGFWRFDNVLVLVFVPLLFLILYIDMSQCISTFGTKNCLLTWNWWFFSLIIGVASWSYTLLLSKFGGVRLLEI